MPRGEHARYVPDRPGDYRPHKDGSGSFSSFAVSEQIRKPLKRAAFDIIALAKADPTVTRSTDERDGHYVDHFSINEAHGTYIKTRFGRVPRAVVEVINDAKNAVAVEFGSGESSVGDSAGEGRPQGGWNKQKRPLGRAASRIGDFHE